MTFEDWFDGEEGFGFRSERFFDGLPTLTESESKYIILWLKTAYGQGVLDGFDLGRKK